MICCRIREFYFRRLKRITEKYNTKNTNRSLKTTQQTYKLYLHKKSQNESDKEHLIRLTFESKHFWQLFYGILNIVTVSFITIIFNFIII